MDPHSSFVRFGIVAVCTCVPTYILIVGINSDKGAKFLDRAPNAVIEAIFYSIIWFAGLFLPNSKFIKTYKETHFHKKKEERVQRHRKQQFRSLTAREDIARRSSDLGASTGRSQPYRLPFPQPTGINHRESAVKFTEPEYDEKQPNPANQRRNPVMAQPDGNLSDPGQLNGPASVRSMSESVERGSITRTLSNRFSGNELPKSPV
jgi:hypothetical protein